MPFRRMCIAANIVSLIHCIYFSDIINFCIVDALITLQLPKLVIFIAVCTVDSALFLSFVAVGSKAVHDKILFSQTMLSCMSCMEEYKYNSYQNKINVKPPEKVMMLNYQYDHGTDGQCGICLNSFGLSNTKESILHCGHKFHKLCLRRWELEKFNKKPYISYKCPKCNVQYGYKQKWNYF